MFGNYICQLRDSELSFESKTVKPGLHMAARYHTIAAGIAGTIATTMLQPLQLKWKPLFLVLPASSTVIVAVL